MSTFNIHNNPKYYIPLLLQIKKLRPQEVADLCPHSSIKQKSWDSPKQSTSRANALRHSILQALHTQILFMPMLKLWVPAAHFPSTTNWGSTQKPLLGRKVGSILNSSSSSMGRFLMADTAQLWRQIPGGHIQDASSSQIKKWGLYISSLIL